jgi:hypothetical protein
MSTRSPLDVLCLYGTDRAMAAKKLFKAARAHAHQTDGGQMFLSYARVAQAQAMAANEIMDMLFDDQEEPCLPTTS